MYWSDHPNGEEDILLAGMAEQGEGHSESPLRSRTRRFLWLILTLLVILSLLAPLLLPFFAGKFSRPREEPDGLQAGLPPATVLVVPSRWG